MNVDLLNQPSKERIKVLYIIDQLTGNRGGTERQLIEIINGLDVRLERHLVCLNNSPWFSSSASVFRCNSTVLNINKFGKLSTYFEILNLIAFIKNYRPDVIHTFFPVGNIVGVVAASLAGVKNIISSRRDYGEWMNVRYLIATRIANRFVTKIIANSAQVKDLTEKREKTGNGQVEVILNGIDTGLFNNIVRDNNLRRRLGIPDDDSVVGIVANFRPMKHHHIFIQAAYDILKKKKNVSFILVGLGFKGSSTEEKCKALGESLNIQDKLLFVGTQEDVIPFLSIMDVGVNCSKREGLSNAVMEYMAAGIPCVVSNAGGNPDLITHDVNGYVFELDDYKNLADLTIKLLYDEATRMKFIKNAREKIEKEMSVAAMLSNYEQYYERLVNTSQH